MTTSYHVEQCCLFPGSPPPARLSHLLFYFQMINFAAFIYAVLDVYKTFSEVGVLDHNQLVLGAAAVQTDIHRSNNNFTYGSHNKYAGKEYCFLCPQAGYLKEFFIAICIEGYFNRTLIQAPISNLETCYNFFLKKSWLRDIYTFS